MAFKGFLAKGISRISVKDELKINNETATLFHDVLVIEAKNKGSIQEVHHYMGNYIDTKKVENTVNVNVVKVILHFTVISVDQNKGTSNAERDIV